MLPGRLMERDQDVGQTGLAGRNRCFMACDDNAHRKDQDERADKEAQLKVEVPVELVAPSVRSTGTPKVFEPPQSCCCRRRRC